MKSIKQILALVLFLSLPSGCSKSSDISESTSTLQPQETVVTVNTEAKELAEKYNPIWDKYSSINEDYIAYLEWENDLLYNYEDDTIDSYPHAIVRSRILDEGSGDINAANSEYMRNDITHESKSFGQDFIDGETSVDENYVPTQQNIIIYGHYVYPSKYGVDYLKFTPLHKFKDMENFEDYDTFTLTFNHQQRTYQVVHAFTYNKSWFTTREESPLALSYTPETMETYLELIDVVYGDIIDSDIEITADDNLVTLQTCVENRDDQLFFVVAKEIDRIDF